MRLKTSPDDPYLWERMKEKEHLFQKNLSDLSISQLKELHDGVDKSYMAIWKPSGRSERQIEKPQEDVYALQCKLNRSMADAF